MATITIKVEEVSDELFLRQEVATGELPDGTKFVVCGEIVTGSFLFEFHGEKRQTWIVRMKDCLEAVIKLRETNTGATT